MIDNFEDKYRWLSNFWPCSVWYREREYRTVEHAYQAAKATSDQDRAYIALAETPGIAKRRGRAIDIRGDWESVKLAVMFDLLLQKFKNPVLRGLLIDTGNQNLVEGNTWGDTYWGVCNGRGENHLGRLIMKVREIINEEERRAHICERGGD